MHRWLKRSQPEWCRQDEWIVEGISTEGHAETTAKPGSRSTTESQARHLEPERQARGALGMSWHHLGESFGEGPFRAIGIAALKASDVQPQSDGVVGDWHVSGRADVAGMDASETCWHLGQGAEWPLAWASTTKVVSSSPELRRSTARPGRPNGSKEGDIRWVVLQGLRTQLTLKCNAGPRSNRAAVTKAAPEPDNGVHHTYS